MYQEESPIKIEIVKEESLKDETLAQVIQNVKSGSWKDVKGKKLTSYFEKRLSFEVEDDCLYYGNRLVVPRSLQEKALESLHDGHIGIVRMKSLARSLIWWKDINNDIEKYVKECYVCQVTGNKNKNRELSSWPITTKPFERVHIDFFDLGTDKFLMVFIRTPNGLK